MAKLTFYGPRKLLRKYLYLFFLNMILSLILLVPLGSMVIRVLAELEPLNLLTALTVILASSFLPYPVLNVVYLIHGARSRGENTEVYRQRMETEEKFIDENNLYIEGLINKRGLLALFFLAGGVVWIWFFKGNPLLVASLILNLSFFI